MLSITVSLTVRSLCLLHFLTALLLRLPHLVLPRTLPTVNLVVLVLHRIFDQVGIVGLSTWGLWGRNYVKMVMSGRRLAFLGTVEQRRVLMRCVVLRLYEGESIVVVVVA